MPVLEGEGPRKWGTVADDYGSICLKFKFEIYLLKLQSITEWWSVDRVINSFIEFYGHRVSR